MKSRKARKLRKGLKRRTTYNKNKKGGYFWTKKVCYDPTPDDQPSDIWLGKYLEGFDEKNPSFYVNSVAIPQTKIGRTRIGRLFTKKDNKKCVPFDAAFKKTIDNKCNGMKQNKTKVPKACELFDEEHRPQGSTSSLNRDESPSLDSVEGSTSSLNRESLDSVNRPRLLSLYPDESPRASVDSSTGSDRSSTSSIGSEQGYDYDLTAVNKEYLKRKKEMDEFLREHPNYV